MLWCQMKTAGYHNVIVRNFTTSWRDGRVFNTIIHKHGANLIQYDNDMFTLNQAFEIADKEFDLVKLLDAEHVFVDNPDKKSIITNVVTHYHNFDKWKQETRRISKVLKI